MYDENDPRHGSVVPGNLPNPQEAYKGYRSLFLTQKPLQMDAMNIENDPNVKVLELRNEDVELPLGDDTLYWCKMFKLQDIYQRSHVVKVSIEFSLFVVVYLIGQHTFNVKYTHFVFIVNNQEHTIENVKRYEAISADKTTLN